MGSEMCIRDSTKTNTFTSNIRLKGLEQLLPPSFIRVHRSYIVNRKLITAINLSTNELHILEHKVPFSRRTKMGLLQDIPVVK